MIDLFAKKSYFDLGQYKASLERTSSGYIKATVKDATGYEISHLFSNVEGAMTELLSYLEISPEDYED